MILVSFITFGVKYIDRCREYLKNENKKGTGSGGIRTHASEETGALNQRLRPLGHATFLLEIIFQTKLFTDEEGQQIWGARRQHLTRLFFAKFG